MTSFAHLPGGDLIEQGIAEGTAGCVTSASCLVAVGRTRLGRAGIKFSNDCIRLIADPERQLYQLLCQESNDPYSRYNSLIRRLISFEQSLEQQHAREKITD